jgi:hypothetical protein
MIKVGDWVNEPILGRVQVTYINRMMVEVAANHLNKDGTTEKRYYRISINDIEKDEA